MGSEQSFPRTTPSVSARVTLKSAAGVRGFVDGAWWPRSTDSTTEFPALLAALTAEGGHIGRLVYNLTAWQPAPRELDVRGRRVRLDGFHALDRRTVSLTGPDGHRTVLLVVPPAATDLVANAVLATAAEPDNIASPGELLAEDRSPETTPAAAPLPQPAEVPPEVRWETDGGHLLTASPA